MPKRKIAVLIVDDHQSFAEALKLALGLQKDIRVIGVTTDGDSAVSMAAQDPPDVVLMDIQMPGMDGIQTTRQIRAVSPQARVVMLTAHESDLLLAKAIEAGAAGYLSKLIGLAEVAGAVRRAFRGESLLPPDEVHRVLRYLRHRRAEHANHRQRMDRLTPRESEILHRMADGMSTPQIALALQMSPYTVRTHIQNILTKLRVHSKVEALAFAVRHGDITART